MFAYRFIVRILIAASLFAASTVDVHAYMGPCEALGVCDDDSGDNVLPPILEPDQLPPADPPPPDPGVPPVLNLPPPDPIPLPPIIPDQNPIPPAQLHAASPVPQPTITHNSAPLPASGMGMTEIAVLAIIVLIAASYRFSRFSHQKS